MQLFYLGTIVLLCAVVASLQAKPTLRPRVSELLMRHPVSLPSESGLLVLNEFQVQHQDSTAILVRDEGIISADQKAKADADQLQCTLTNEQKDKAAALEVARLADQTAQDVAVKAEMTSTTSNNTVAIDTSLLASKTRQYDERVALDKPMLTELDASLKTILAQAQQVIDLTKCSDTASVHVSAYSWWLPKLCAPDQQNYVCIDAHVYCATLEEFLKQLAKEKRLSEAEYNNSNHTLGALNPTQGAGDLREYSAQFVRAEAQTKATLAQENTLKVSADTVATRLGNEVIEQLLDTTAYLSSVQRAGETVAAFRLARSVFSSGASSVTAAVNDAQRTEEVLVEDQARLGEEITTAKGSIQEAADDAFVIAPQIDCGADAAVCAATEMKYWAYQFCHNPTGGYVCGESKKCVLVC
eukprot:TRINITY_DN1605_c0_g1_i6.p1 TRINITY_DN1605_c0_g1~~TRINITY_DN1605_c0_g1_i6.p1  ORF type:complete len:414 (+),score=103.30 TRINITY_DN1605_c0_g1_i6:189-1430(+)